MGLGANGAQIQREAKLDNLLRHFRRRQILQENRGLHEAIHENEIAADVRREPPAVNHLALFAHDVTERKITLRRIHRILAMPALGR